MNTGKPKLNIAIYWGAACGGCCVSVLDVHEGLLEIINSVEFSFWPIALDTKYHEVENWPDKHVDICLFNGAVRNSENEHMAKVLRKKSKVLIAYGACSHLGGIPGLANLSTKESLFKRVYDESESTVNESKVRPQTEFKVPEGTLTLPTMYNDVRPLDQVVDVDYFLPGCPPQTERLVEVLTLVLSGAALPPKGSVVGAYEKALCDYCDRVKSENKKISKFYRHWEINDDGKTCLFEQGVICMGPATRGGCGARCIKANKPCGGCYGPTAECSDPGATMISAIATMIASDDPKDIEKTVESIADPAGTFYRYSVPNSILRRSVK